MSILSWSPSVLKFKALQVEKSTFTCLQQQVMFNCGFYKRKSPPPFSLLQITDRSRYEAPMPCAAAGNNAGDVQVASIVRGGRVDSSMIAAG